MTTPHNCSVLATVNVIAGRWKPVILFHLKDGPCRFNELRRLIPEVTQRMLTQQLRALEKDGIITRTDHATVPPHVDYALSAAGLTLSPILDAMEAWGEAHGERVTGRTMRNPPSRTPSALRSA